MKTLPQIAFDFSADKETRQDEPGKLPSESQLLQNEQTAAGVGVRLKHTRNLEHTGEERTAEQSAETVSGQSVVIEATIIELPPLEKEPSTVKKPKSTRGRKSLKQVSAEADLIEIPGDEELFSKQYYTMGEVAAMFRVNQSLLRFWEAEFDILKPRKNKKGDRHFRPVDIKNLHLIYNLLRQRKYTIEGAIEFLKNSKKAEARFDAIRRLQEIKAFLLELKARV